MSQNNKIPLLVLSGPTASGKTTLSVELAKRLNAQIVCADSMQVYQTICVGTARPTEEEMQGIQHHLFGCIPLEQTFSVARYAEAAHQIIQKIYQEGSLPLLCGGTGLYIQAVTENLQYAAEQHDPILRRKLRERIEYEGGEALLKELFRIDPQTAERLHANDHGRIVRALEIFYMTGETLTQQNKNSRRFPSPYQVCHLTLDYRNRDFLYDRIDHRVFVMLQNGLEQEARDFYTYPNAATAAQAIGYKELKPYINGEISKKQAISQLQQATRRYAKRQLSWFRHMPQVHTLYCDDYANAEQLVQAAMQTVSFSFDERR